MTKYRGIVCLLIALVLVFALLPAQVLAIDPIDPKAPVSLTLDFRYTDTPIPGAVFHVYRLACVDESANFAVEKQFAEYPISLKNNTVETWNELAYTLKGFVEADDLAPMATLTTDEAGQARLEDIEAGLYLLLGEKLTDGDFTYIIQPTVVCLPDRAKDEETWTYDATVFPKSSREENPVEKTISRKVLKVWDDNDYADNRPKEISFTLLRDGVAYDTVTVTEADNWRYEWKDLPACDDSGAQIDWLVIEKAVPEYTTKVEQNGPAFIVTNTSPAIKPPVKPDPVLPKTGLLWWPVPMLLCFGVLFLIIGVSRRKKDAV